MTAPRVLGEPLTYDDVIKIVDARLNEINAPRTALEDYGKLTPGLLGKCMGASRVKTFGIVGFLRVCEVIGVRMILVEQLDVDAIKDEMGEYFRTRETDRGHAGRGLGAGRQWAIRKPISPEVKAEAARQFGAMARGVPKGLSAKAMRQRRRAAKLGGRARWHKPRVVEVTSPAEGAAIRAADTSAEAALPTDSPPAHRSRSGATSEAKRPDAAPQRRASARARAKRR